MTMSLLFEHDFEYIEAPDPKDRHIESKALTNGLIPRIYLEYLSANDARHWYTRNG